MSLQKADIPKIIQNGKDIGDLVSNIECINQMIAGAYHSIVQLEEIDYSDGEVCEEIKVDGVDCCILSNDTAIAVRDLIIRDKMVMIEDWNGEIVDMKRRLTYLL